MEEVLEEQPKEADENAASSNSGKKPKKKILKIVICIFSSLLLLFIGAVGGYFYAKLTIKPVLVNTSTYKTYGEVLEEYALTTAEKNKTLFELSASEDYYTIYKKCYSAVLNTDKLNVITTGQTSSGGLVTVYINNTKKRQGNYFYMHTVSTGSNSGLSKMTDIDLECKFDIVNQMVHIDDNLKTDNVFNGQNITEAKYVSKYGLLSYVVCNYDIIKDNVLTFALAKDGELNSLTMTLKPVESAEGLIVQMNALSGQVASYESGYVTYKVNFTDDFIVKTIQIDEAYKVNYGVEVTCVSSTVDTYYYEGDSGYQDLAEGEVYGN